jgi:adenylylsulfate kinase
MAENIFPIHNMMVPRQQKEALLKTAPMVLWFTGLSGSGKSTVALSLEHYLHNMGIPSMILDGDNLRNGLCQDLGFTETERNENIRRVAEVAKLFVLAGIPTLCTFISPTQKDRDMAKNIIGPSIFYEIHIKASVETCEQRDVKGLYKKARAGLIPNFTGLTAPYEAPTSPSLILDTEQYTLQEVLQQLIQFINNNILGRETTK